MGLPPAAWDPLSSLLPVPRAASAWPLLPGSRILQPFPGVVSFTAVSRAVVSISRALPPGSSLFCVEIVAWTSGRTVERSQGEVRHTTRNLA